MIRLLDLPGTYSLSALSPDEMVAVDVLLGHQPGESRPDLVLAVVDASNLERNLYLVSQIFELGVPVVVALNMTDVAEGRGIRIDAVALTRALGVPVIPTQAHRGAGVPELCAAMWAALRKHSNAEDEAIGRGTGNLDLGDALHAQVDALYGELAPSFLAKEGRDLHPFEVLRAIVDRGGHAETRLRVALGDAALERIDEARAQTSGTLPLPALEAKVRYGWIRERVSDCVRREAKSGVTWSERIDRVLTHRVFGLLIFAALMMLLFQSIFAWAGPIMDFVEGIFTSAGDLVDSQLPEGALRSLLVDGVIAGVGMVVVFLPQILILFFFIGILEDCGYMARAAFLMDKLMSKCGLSGKSFIPMLSGFACAIPGIMATRVIENRRDRIATILVTPLMSCSARLPVYAIFIGTFIPSREIVPGILGLQAFTMFALYVLGMVVAVAMAWTFKKTLLRGPKPAFVLELPSYKRPAVGTVLLRLYDRARAFLIRAGTIILAMAIVVWALSYFPRPAAIGERYEAARVALTAELPEGPEREERLKRLHLEESGEYLRQSYFGRLGHLVEPVFEPLGWDWRISMATMVAFPAREVLVSTLGTVFNLGAEVDEESKALRHSLKAATRSDDASAGAPLFTIPVALSILVFFALCCQCGATVATIKRETNSWGWAWFTFGYMTVLAYAGAFATYQIGVAL